MLLTPASVEALIRHRERQDVERDLVGEAWNQLDRVFCNTVGDPLGEKELLNRFCPLLERAGLPKVRFQDLRHRTPSPLFGEGVHPEIVSELHGRSAVGITLDTYSHVTETIQRGAVDRLEGLIGGQKPLSRTGTRSRRDDKAT